MCDDAPPPSGLVIGDTVHTARAYIFQASQGPGSARKRHLACVHLRRELFRLGRLLRPRGVRIEPRLQGYWTDNHGKPIVDARATRPLKTLALFAVCLSRKGVAVLGSFELSGRGDIADAADWPRSFRSDCYDAVMPKRLPDTDFRARHRVLTRGDFAYAPKPERPASDAINKSTWDSIVTLPDDVAVRTSNHHGTALKQLDDLWGAWVESFGETQDCLFSAMLDAGDDFQSATYTALTGFYRLSVSALRSALELIATGTWTQVCGKDAEYRAWRAGKTPLSFGQACDGPESWPSSSARLD
jgi:hypothetical protein